MQMQQYPSTLCHQNMTYYTLLERVGNPVQESVVVSFTFSLDTEMP